MIAATDQPANPPAFFPVHFAPTDRRKEGPQSEEGLREDPFTQRILSIGLVPEFVNNLLQEVRGLQKKQG